MLEHPTVATLKGRTDTPNRAADEVVVGLSTAIDAFADEDADVRDEGDISLNHLRRGVHRGHPRGAPRELLHARRRFKGGARGRAGFKLFAECMDALL